MPDKVAMSHRRARANQRTATAIAVIAAGIGVELPEQPRRATDRELHDARAAEWMADTLEAIAARVDPEAAANQPDPEITALYETARTALADAGADEQLADTLVDPVIILAGTVDGDLDRAARALVTAITQHTTATEIGQVALDSDLVRVETVPPAEPDGEPQPGDDASAQHLPPNADATAAQTATTDAPPAAPTEPAVLIDEDSESDLEADEEPPAPADAPVAQSARSSRRGQSRKAKTPTVA